MTPRNILAVVIVTLLALGAAFALGWQQNGARYDRALQRSAHESDSLRQALATQVAVVVHDTIRRDSLVTKWRTLVQTVTQTDTVHHTDTVTVPGVIQVADGIITKLDAAHRQCVSVLMSCEQAAQAANDRADKADARADVFADAAKSARKHATAERAACAVSAVTNVLQWRFAK